MSEPTEEENLRHIIADAAEYYKRAYERHVAPYIERLTEIERLKNPLVILIDKDGFLKHISK